MRLYGYPIRGLTKVLYGAESEAKRRRLKTERRMLNAARKATRAAEKRRRRAYAKSARG